VNFNLSRTASYVIYPCNKNLLIYPHRRTGITSKDDFCSAVTIFNCVIQYVFAKTEYFIILTFTVPSGSKSVQNGNLVKLSELMAKEISIVRTSPRARLELAAFQALLRTTA